MNNNSLFESDPCIMSLSSNFNPSMFPQESFKTPNINHSSKLNQPMLKELN
jgi:hypothetical protein